MSNFIPGLERQIYFDELGEYHSYCIRIETCEENNANTIYIVGLLYIYSQGKISVDLLFKHTSDRQF